MAWEILPTGTVRLQRLKEAEPALIAGSIPALRLEIWGETEDSPTTAIQVAMTVEEARTIAAGLLQAAERALEAPPKKPS
jgi:hypothetical protein